MILTRISVNNPVFATMMMAALMVFGLFSTGHLAIDQFPNVDFPIVVVATDYPGAAPESVESDVTRPLEEAINTIAGIKTLTSRSYEGRSVVIAEFELSVPSTIAVQDVREKVTAVQPTFRTEVKQPQVTRFNPDDQPIISIAVGSDLRDARSLTTLADQIVVKRLENVRGVGRATIVGGTKREIQIRLSPERLQAFGVGVDEVIRAIREENQTVPSGTVRRSADERVVEVSGRIEEPRQFLDLIVARRGTQPVRLGQVAALIDGEAERLTSALLDGRRTVAIDIVKVQGANTLEVAKGVGQAMEDLKRRGLPPDVTLTAVRDSSRGIAASVTNVEHTLVEGGLLTVLIVMLFLNSWRSTVITGLTLPVSVMGTFAVLAALGYSLNVMTLMALSLAVGILIDDAIVVRENITRHLAMGKNHYRAALEATDEIGLAVLATTFTIVAVFLPVAFMGGIIGRFFLEFGITVSAAVLISLFVSFTLDPMLSSVWPDPPPVRPGLLHRLGSRFERWLDHAAAAYRRLIGWALRRRLVVLALALASLIACVPLAGLTGVEFVPEADLGEMIVQIETPVGSALDYTETKLQQAEAALREFPEIAYSYGTVNTGQAVGNNQAQIYLRLVPTSQRRLTPNQLAQPMRRRLAAIPGLTVSLGTPGIGGIQKTIQVSIQGRDIATLDRLAIQVMGIMRAEPGFVDIDSNSKAARATWSVKLDRDRASDLGIGTQQLADTLRPLFAGDAISTWRAPDSETYDVHVRLPEIDRSGLADLRRIAIASRLTDTDGTPRMIPLPQIARIDSTIGASQINRRDLQREINVAANLAGRAAGDAGKALGKALEKLDLPPGYRIQFGGSTKDINETSGFAAQAMLLAVILIYLILASQFGSFLQPLAIMMALPLSLVGVFLGLLIAGSTLNVFSAIGFIMLMGLVTKNAILLVDFANRRRADGLSLTDALIDAGAVRLRPIVMTTMAMIFGMLPLALAFGEGARQRAPMAHAVIGGLISSTLLTLIVVPVIVTYLDQFARWIGRLTAARRATQPKASPAE